MTTKRRKPAEKAEPEKFDPSSLTQGDLVAFIERHCDETKYAGPNAPRMLSCKHCGSVLWNVGQHMTTIHPDVVMAELAAEPADG